MKVSVRSGYVLFILFCIFSWSLFYFILLSIYWFVFLGILQLENRRWTTFFCFIVLNLVKRHMACMLMWSTCISSMLLQMLSVGRQFFVGELHLLFRMLKAFLSIALLAIPIVLFKVYGLNIADLFAAILALTPTGWGLLLVSSELLWIFFVTSSLMTSLCQTLSDT